MIGYPPLNAAHPLINCRGQDRLLVVASANKRRSGWWRRHRP